MSLATDTARMFAIDAPIEEVGVGEEFDAGLDYLVQVIDTDGAADITLTYEDMSGERCEFTRSAGTAVTCFLPYRSPSEVPRRRCRTAHDVFVSGWQDAAALPAPSGAALDRLTLLWRPYLLPEMAGRQAA